MAYGRRRYGRKGRLAHKAARKTFRRMIRKPKIVVVKKYANTVGQIVARKGRLRPSHGGGRHHGRHHRRY